VAEELAEPGQVGEALEPVAEAERVVTHRFECLAPGYRGWHWAVTVARAAYAKNVTVDEAVLLPGPEALLPPEWVPWSQRLRPGDVGVGDLLPTPADDPRLMPGYGQVDLPESGDDDDTPVLDLERDEDAAVAWELGLGRARVLSPEGRDDAAMRWYTGEHGPTAPIAEAAPANCATCGFFIPLSGSLRRVFGVCANEYAPDDGSVVSVDHGCGAHSEAEVTPAARIVPPPVVDELGYDMLTRHPEEHDPGSVDDGSPGEDHGHS
jgi:hypothetical protein